MDDDETLFMNNPLKALFIQNQEIIGMLKKITQEIDDEGLSDKELENLEDFYNEEDKSGN